MDHLVSQVVVVGLATDYCVGSTALHALQQVSLVQEEEQEQEQDQDQDQEQEQE